VGDNTAETRSLDPESTTPRTGDINKQQGSASSPCVRRYLWPVIRLYSKPALCIYAGKRSCSTASEDAHDDLFIIEGELASAPALHLTTTEFHSSASPWNKPASLHSATHVLSVARREQKIGRKAFVAHRTRKCKSLLHVA
jgi:hypothetical protein